VKVSLTGKLFLVHAFSLGIEISNSPFNLVEEYEGVEIKFVHGQVATLTIFHDGKKKEDVLLSELKTKAEMHFLMVNKGFVRKTEEEIVKVKELRKKENHQEALRLHDAKVLAKEHRQKQQKQKEERESNKAREEGARLSRTVTARPVLRNASATKPLIINAEPTLSPRVAPESKQPKKQVTSEQLREQMRQVKVARDNIKYLSLEELDLIEKHSVMPQKQIDAARKAIAQRKLSKEQIETNELGVASAPQIVGVSVGSIEAEERHLHIAPPRGVSAAELEDLRDEL
jgi:hypothetical protein